MKKPIVSTDCTPLKRIIEETQCGIVGPSGDAESMADAIKKIYHDPVFAQKMGENGRRSVETKYNWKNESDKLIEIYKRFER